jgi:hypothetical protein
MGQRANLIVIDQRRTDVFYTHWRANTLTRDLFWGPVYATAFCRAQRRVTAEDLLDDVWAEGGAILDHDRRALLLFGGEDISYDVPTRRLYLRLLSHAWSGWEVRWAYEGVCDLADCLSVPRERVLNKSNALEATAFDLADPVTDAATVASLRAPNKIVDN